MPATTATVRTAPVLKLAFSAGGVEQRALRGVSISPEYPLKSCMCAQCFVEVMAGHELGFQVVYRGETLEYYRPGGWVFFQRPKD